MAIAQNTEAAVPVTIQNSKKLNPYQLRQPVPLGAELLKQWWHIKAYGTILGIMLLTLVSLVFLQISWSCRQMPFLSSKLGRK